MTKNQIDRLGTRLRTEEPSDADLRLLDQYRESFADACDRVTHPLRTEFDLTPTGRAAKSTLAIMGKLRRESVRHCTYYLIEYDRPSGRLVRFEPCSPGDRARATDARLDIESALNRRGVRDREVVTLEAASEEALRRAHRRYFEDLARIASSFDGQ